jgi:hypothetical protein
MIAVLSVAGAVYAGIYTVTDFTIIHAVETIVLAASFWCSLELLERTNPHTEDA